MADTIIRNRIADFLNVGDSTTPNYVLMGIGFNSLDESPNAQTDSKTYINQVAQTSQIKSYQTSFSFDTDLIVSEEAVLDIYDIGTGQKTGSDAERDYVRVELFEPVTGSANWFHARKFTVAVGVASISGNGGETVKVTGTLNGVGDAIPGFFNTETKIFTETITP